MAVRENVKLGYRLDWANNRMVVNHKFYQRASQIGSAEYKLILQVQNDFPSIEVCEESGRKITTSNRSKGLTYDYMRHVLSMLPDGEDLLEEFNNQVLVIPDGRHRYQFAKDWFIRQVPDYKSPFETIERIREASELNNDLSINVSKSPAKKAIKLS